MRRSATCLLGLLVMVLSLQWATAGVVQDRTQMLDLINQVRRQEGLPALSEEPRLTRMAQDHAEQLAARNELSHRGLDGTRLAGRLAGVGYRFRMAAENLSNGHGTPKATLESWMDSPAHRRNILIPDFRDVGIGHAVRADGKHFWVLVLAAPFAGSAYPLGIDPGEEPETPPRTEEPRPPWP